MSARLRNRIPLRDPMKASASKADYAVLFAVAAIIATAAFRIFAK